MPFITIDAGRMSKDQKKALIKEITKLASEILNIKEEAFSVLLRENDPDNIGTGGRMLSEVIGKENPGDSK